jgi:large subunit ribosomal protein L9
VKVILLQDVNNLGLRGEIKEVADGYGLNYLIPKKLAALATPQMAAKFEEEARLVRLAAERDLRRAQLLAGKLDGIEVDLVGKANLEGTLYAAITPVTISAYLTKQGYPVDKGQIVLRQAIKEIGDHKATIQFRHGLEAEILVHVKGLEPGGITS